MSVKREGKLEGLEARLDNGMKRGLILAGKLVAQRATRKAPIDKGRLKRSITHGQPERQGDRYRIEVGTNVEYAPYQEFGTGDKAEDPSKSKDPTRPGIPPHPYLRPALKESKDDIRKLITKSVRGALKR